MRPIPAKLRKQMNSDPFYKKCCICGFMQGIEWHHVFEFARKQIQEKWAIIPVCDRCHKAIHKNDHPCKTLSKRIALKRATDEDLAKYPKVGSDSWEQQKRRLGINE